MDPLERQMLGEGGGDDDDRRAPEADDISEPGSDADGDVAHADWRAPDAPPERPEGMPDTLANVLEGNRRNTGPKGVLADYRREQRRKQVEAEKKSFQRDAMVRRAGYGTDTALPSESYAATKSLREAVARNERLPGMDAEASGAGESGAGAGGAGAGAHVRGDGDSSDGSDLEDDAFLEEYRRKRFEQMKAASGRPTFGTVEDCDPFEFLEATESSHHKTVVVALLHEPYIPECQSMSKALTEVARRHPFLRCLRLRPSQAKEDFDHISLPCLQLFQNGSMLKSVIRLHEEIGEFAGADDLEWYLASLGVLDVPVDSGRSRKGASAPSS